MVYIILFFIFSGTYRIETNFFSLNDPIVLQSRSPIVIHMSQSDIKVDKHLSMNFSEQRLFFRQTCYPPYTLISKDLHLIVVYSTANRGLHFHAKLGKESFINHN